MKNKTLIIVLTFCAQLEWAQNPRYAPSDETYLDAELNEFTTKLLEAIDARDQHFLYDALSIDVSGLRGEAEGLSDFIQEWDADKDSSIVWPLMKRAILLGGVFLHDSADLTGRYQFVFPYVYSMPLDIEDDYFSIGVITGKNVNLREGPDTASPVKTKLTYDVIWFLDGAEYGSTKAGTNRFDEPEWYKVETYDRQFRGWVNWRYVYSPVRYRLFLFKNDRGAWKISAFLAGD